MSETLTRTVTTFTDYLPLALSTARDTAFAPRYIINGLRSEIGEAIGKFAKFDLKGGTPEAFAKMRDGMILELGDILWYTALAVHRRKLPAIEITDRAELHFTYGPDELEAWIEHDLDYMYRHAATFTWGTFTHADARYIVYTVEHLAHLIGSDLPEVMSLNTAKLGARQQGGTIIGEGDYR